VVVGVVHHLRSYGHDHLNLGWRSRRVNGTAVGISAVEESGRGKKTKVYRRSSRDQLEGNQSSHENISQFSSRCQHSSCTY
jgi:hypothetical protein